MLPEFPINQMLQIWRMQRMEYIFNKTETPKTT